MEFKIGFVRDAEDDELNDTNYTADGGAFPDDVDIDTIFSTDKTNTINNITRHCQAGYGLIFDNNHIADTIPFGTDSGTAQRKPEQHVANTIAAYGSTVRRVMHVDLKNDNVSGDHMPRCRVTHEGQSYYPVAVSHRWRDNIVNLTLMEI